jgi:hypothetical protein
VIRVRFLASALLTACIVLLILTAGCADVTTTQKVGDFGTTFGASSDEQKAIDWFKTTYGDPMTNNDKPARFVEPLITTGLDTNKMPKDKVTTFPQSGGSVYFFVIYDNFKKGDPITVSWTYLENGRIVTTVEKQAGGDFGRFIVEFQKPDSGWGKGRQNLKITGDGASASVDFTIGDALQTTPLPYNPEGSAGTALTTPAIIKTINPVVSGTPVMRGTGTIPTAVPTTVTTTVAPGSSPPATTCGWGETLCNGECTTLLDDPANCGGCGRKCSGNYPYCDAGHCVKQIL